MCSKIAEIKRKLNSNEKLIFYIISILFTFTFIFINLAVDDVGPMRVEGGTLAAYWQKSLGFYYTWSSRVLVNLVLFIFTDNSLVLWAIYMGISLFVLLNALSMLSSSNSNKELNYFIACIVMMYPFQDLSSAGWIATMTTYLSPIAFGLMALVPIKKIMDSKRLRWWECVFYSICLIYGANNEQMMVVLLGSYIVAVIYFITKRKLNIYIVWSLLLAVGSCIFTLTCPGNFSRDKIEIATWYPTYGMLNTIDKIDLGLFTTLKWLLFDNNLFVIFTCILLAFLIWQRYEESLYRVLSLIPVLTTVLLGPLKTITIALYPSLDYLAGDISQYGLVTVENGGNIGAFGQYFIMGTIIIIICIEILLLQDSIEGLVASFTLMASGTASRIAIGFSPTIFISGTRTCAVMSFCIIAVVIMLYSNYVANSGESVRCRYKLSIFMKISLICSFVNLWFLVFSKFR